MIVSLASLSHLRDYVVFQADRCHDFEAISSILQERRAKFKIGALNAASNPDAATRSLRNTDVDVENG